MVDRDRFYLLKLLNATYRLSVLEEIPMLQDQLAKVIRFYRYFFNQGLKRVRLGEELEYLRLFLELYHQCGGQEFDLQCPADSAEIDIEILANSIIIPVQNSLLNINQPQAVVEVAVFLETGGGSGQRICLAVVDRGDGTVLFQSEI